MKLLAYYLQILLPLPVIFLLYQITYNSTLFLVSFFSYIIFYRGLVDGFRLQKLGLLNKGEMWKMFVPFYTFRLNYFYELYFENK